MIYLVLTVSPISGIKEMKFMDIGRLGKFYDLALGNDVIITCTPRSRQVILKVTDSVPANAEEKQEIDRDTVEEPRPRR